ncbi:MAG: hypothetical protein OEU54_11520 [Gemmatimonadota bacterium]|nr:hypothetical protein [Gemmatimonadota bacterium]
MKRKTKSRPRKTPVAESWSRVAADFGGETFWGKSKKEPDRLDVPHRVWRIVTDIHVQSHGEGSTTYTRVRALFVRTQPFRLTVTKRNPFHSLGVLFGYRAVPIGYSQLEKALFVRSDRADLTRSMLRGTALGQGMMREPVKLSVARPGRPIRKIAGDTVGEVQILKRGKVHDVSELRELVQTCMWTLDELDRLGVADDTPVEGVAL